MRRFFFYLLLALLFALLQTSVFPLFFSPDWRPSLILLLVLYVGLREPSLRAVVTCLFLGAIQDSFCGHSVGLYLTVYLTILLIVLGLSEQLNIESSPLLLALVAGGTLVENLLLWFYLTVLADSAPALHILLPGVPQQLGVNLLAALLLLALLARVKRMFGLRRGFTSLVVVGRDHVS